MSNRNIAAFTGKDYERLSSAIEQLAATQMGIFADPFTADELADLFVPPHLLSALRTVYKVEQDYKAGGDIHVDLLGLVPKPVSEEAFRLSCTKATLTISFNRRTMPDGFVTPTPVFGTSMNPVKEYKGSASPELVQRFAEQCAHMLQVQAHWSTIMWTFATLQGTMRTPQQMRYVWPAIYTLASLARLPMAGSLASPSARAGTNAVSPVELSHFLKPTYEIVSNAALMGIKEDFRDRYRQGQMQISSTFVLTAPDWVEPLPINGI